MTEDATPDEPPPDPALAANWRTIIAVDAGVGLAVVVVGAVAMVWSVVLGGFVGALGATYLVAVAGRARRWAALRRESGL